MHKSPFFLVLFLVSILPAAPAYAYIDPGTGSFLIQGILAAIVGAGVALKVFWGRIKSIFTGSSPDLDDDDDDDE